MPRTISEDRWHDVARPAKAERLPEVLNAGVNLDVLSALLVLLAINDDASGFALSTGRRANVVLGQRGVGVLVA